MRARRNSPSDSGFTLIELLIVIVILGVLATVVVFAVGGITGRGEQSAIAADRSTIEHAEEAHRAMRGSYATEAELVSAGFMRDVSTLHDVTVLPDGSEYTIGDEGSAAPPPPPPAPPPPPPPPAPVATTFAGYSGESYGVGSHTLVLIGGNAAGLFATLTTSATLDDTEVVFLGSGDVVDTDDVLAIANASATYIVAADSQAITDVGTGGTTYVGAYLASIRSWPDQFWWTHSQGVPTPGQLAAQLGVTVS